MNWLPRRLFFATVVLLVAFATLVPVPACHALKIKKTMKVASKVASFMMPPSRKKLYAVPVPFPFPVFIKRKHIYTQVPVVPRYSYKPQLAPQVDSQSYASSSATSAVSSEMQEAPSSASQAPPAPVRLQIAKLYHEPSQLYAREALAASRQLRVALISPTAMAGQAVSTAAGAGNSAVSHYGHLLGPYQAVLAAGLRQLGRKPRPTQAKSTGFPQGVTNATAPADEGPNDMLAFASIPAPYAAVPVAHMVPPPSPRLVRFVYSPPLVNEADGAEEPAAAHGYQDMRGPLQMPELIGSVQRAFGFPTSAHYAMAY